jgi:retinol dehydrogenase 14
MTPGRDPMDGRVCLITGATSGIGRATALALAERGATIAAVARDAEKGERLIRELRARGRGEHISFVADLSSQAQVRRLASEVRTRLPALHVLVNNAAIILPERRATAEGIEMQLAVNYLAPFLITKLLLDLLVASAPARVVNVASQVEAEGVIDFDDLQMTRGYTRLGAYNRSKLAMVLFTYELARRLQGTGVTANCLHPGVIATQLLDDYDGRSRVARMLRRRTEPGPDEGARTSVYLASSPDVATISGRYFREQRIASSSARSMDAALGARLWRVSEELTGLATEPTPNGAHSG